MRSQAWSSQWNVIVISTPGPRPRIQLFCYGLTFNTLYVWGFLCICVLKNIFLSILIHLGKEFHKYEQLKKASHLFKDDLAEQLANLTEPK